MRKHLYSSGKRKLRVRFFIVLLVILILTVYIDCRLRPLVKNIAVHHAQFVATRVINETITQLLSEENLAYEDLVLLEKDPEGNITAIKTDVVKTNRLKSELSAEVQNALSQIDSRDLAVHIGTLTGSSLLMGRGPKLHLKLSLVNSILSEFENQFDEAGVNQTRHQIMMALTAKIYVVIPGVRTATEVKTNVCIAETIIVGKVPGVYGQFTTGNGQLTTE